jgi:hypothetical protein
LWRGSQHGFAASEFHRRCDRHKNTLTIVLDTNDNIFGGFLAPELHPWFAQLDTRQPYSLFNLRNALGAPPRMWRMEPGQGHKALHYHANYSPIFATDIVIADNCNKNWRAVQPMVSLMGTAFLVKEIEVFEIN